VTLVAAIAVPKPTHSAATTNARITTDRTRTREDALACSTPQIVDEPSAMTTRRARGDAVVRCDGEMRGA
jgi:hypothetical protein